ncbi:MAG TPA: HEAT repeat domain-containing protein [Nannocystis sp.]
MATLLACTLAALVLTPAPAPARDLAAPSSPSRPPPFAPPTTSSTSSATPASTPRPAAPAPQLDWRARVAVAVEALQKSDPALLARIDRLQPDRAVEGALSFSQPEVHDPRAAPVLLRRLLRGDDPVKVRCALVDALPLTGGDWQEGAAALVAIDASPQVRKHLVQIMRYADPPHSVHGLRLGFKDEHPEVNIAAARTAGFSKGGAELFPELYSSTFDADWDLRAAAVQALGMLKLPKSRDVLLRALSDEEREVRLQAFLALEQLDPEGILYLPQLETLAKDRKSHRIARKAELLLRKRRAAEKAARRAGSAPAAASTITAEPSPAPAPASEPAPARGSDPAPTGVP